MWRYYGTSAGDCDYLHAFRGMVVNPEQIIVGAGTEYLYGLLIQLLGDDKIYGIENPGYPKIAKIYDSMHVSYSAIDLDEHGVCIYSLEDHQIDIMHLSPSHHFPTGIITPISRRYELLGWASKDENRYIIEDDYDSELRLGGKPIPTLQSIDVSDKVIYMNTFTKNIIFYRKNQLHGTSGFFDRTFFIRNYLFIPVQFLILNSILWLVLWKVEVLKNISTGCVIIIRINEMLF